MSPLLFALPGNEALAAGLARHLACEQGALDLHRFPDGEVNLRFGSELAGREVVIACALDDPNAKVVPLYLACSVARELGAKRVGIVVPYLPYMRQDARFREGEGVTAAHFARLLSSCCDWLVTVDPHLHRILDLGEVYSIATRVVRAAPSLSAWIAANVPDPVVIGPDEESAQWAAEVAAGAGCPWQVLTKQRSGDHQVAVSLVDAAGWQGRTPVLVDDIASTARTMIAAAAQVRAAGLAAPVCIAVHALFAGDAHAALSHAGVARVVTCNTVVHASNAIDLHGPLAAAVRELLGQGA